MTTPLPTRLDKVPIADAVFEIRFDSSLSASTALPGMIIPKLKGHHVTKTAVAQIPDALRHNDPGLRYQPLLRIETEIGGVLISDFSVALSTKLPYCGWDEFKQGILRLIDITNESSVAQSIERISIRYINVVEGGDLADQLTKFRIETTIGGEPIDKLVSYSVRFETLHDGALCIINAGAPGIARTATGQEIHGALIDIDTVLGYAPKKSWGEFSETLTTDLERIKLLNKASFFSCLSQSTIESLGPTYE